MKKLTSFLFFFILTASLWAEKTPEETVTEEPKKSGGFGGPVLKVTRINDVFGLLIGGRGGWVYNHKYAIGGGFYGLLRDIEVEISDAPERDFEFAYSGLELEYILAPSRDIHLSAQTLIGFGGLTDRYQRVYVYYDEYGRLGGPDDSFFIVEPGLNIVWNMKTYLQIHFGGSYRYIRGVGIEGLHNADLNGLSVVVTFRFGRNAKVEPPDQDEFDGIDTFYKLGFNAASPAKSSHSDLLYTD